MTATKSLVFLCDGIEIREQEFCVMKDGEAIPIEPRAFRVLLYLLRNPQRIVTKDELLQSVWDDAAVTENSLARAILKLRQALGDDARSPQYIQTVSRIGYRFVSSVEIREASIAPAADKQVHGVGPESNDDALRLSSAPAGVLTEGRRQWRPGRWLVIIGAVAIGILAVWWIRRWESVHFAR